jgi:hypothetical protein
MKPSAHLALAERVRQTLAEAQLAAGNDLSAAAALRAAAAGGLEDVFHRPTLLAPGRLTGPRES